MSDLPSPFNTWNECRDYYALEALFLGQLLDRRPTRGNERRYREAAAKAVAANDRVGAEQEGERIA